MFYLTLKNNNILNIWLPRHCDGGQ